MSAYRTAPAKAPISPRRRRRWLRLLRHAEHAGRMRWSRSPTARKWYGLTYLFGVVGGPLAVFTFVGARFGAFFAAMCAAGAFAFAFIIFMAALPILPGLRRICRMVGVVRRARAHVRLAAPLPQLRVEDVEKDDAEDDAESTERLSDKPRARVVRA